MKKYEITGMSCAACQTRVEKAVSRVEGVESCAVSLLTNSMGVEGSASDNDIIAAVEKAGYGAFPFNVSTSKTDSSNDTLNDTLKDKESPILVKRLISSVIVLIVLMYFSMGHSMWNWPVIIPVFENKVALAVFEMLLAIIVMVINKKFFISGFSSLFHRAPNMDTLVALGSTASFGYSLVELFIMIDAMGRGDSSTVMKYSMDLYFESAAMIPTLITVGKLLEAKSKGRTTDALKSLMKLSPDTANVERGGETVTIPVGQVAIGDIYILKAGDQIPVDGVVVEGSSAVNEAALTGESVPVDKAVGDNVSAGTINTNGFLKCRATRVGEDTTLSRIIQMVGDAAATKAPLARIADKVSAVFVPLVMGLAVITFVLWMIGGQSVGFSIARAISVLVISCPCALGLATPVAIMVGNGMGAKHGILYKTAEALESAGRIGVVVLDKTGTITKGEPGVTDIIPAEGVDEKMLLMVAFSLEKMSEHPLAKAVTEYCKTFENGMSSVRIISLSDFETLAGSGVRANVTNDEEIGSFKLKSGSLLEGGSYKYISEKLSPDMIAQINTSVDSLAGEGKTPLLFMADGRYLGMIAVADLIKEDSSPAIEELKNMGIRTVMLTGDNAITAKAIAEKAFVDNVIAGVMPDEKEAVISKLQEAVPEMVKVAMVGDGINDAVALTRADIGFAIGAGTDVAVDAADVVLMKNSIRDVAASIRMSRATIRNIHENLFWAFFYNALCIPLAMGLYGIAMKPMYGAAAMALSSFFVCMNALRLNRVKMYSTKRDRVPKVLRGDTLNRKINEIISGITEKENQLTKQESQNIIQESQNIKQESQNIKQDIKEGVGFMEKTLVIEGMMCGHCEATVKKALEALDGVKSASASHEKGTAVVELENDVDNAVLSKAVEDKDYKVLSVN